MSVSVDIRVEDAGWDTLDLETLVQTAAEATLAHLGIDGPAEADLLATSDAAIAELNAEFRGKPSPTNVLSWPAQTLAPPAPGEAPPPPQPDPFGDLALGDIALAYETCTREAEAGGKSLKDHATHLVVHAFLHLLGYDHICDADACLMERCEAEILAALGLANLYDESA